MIKKILSLAVMALTIASGAAQQHKWGDVSRLTVEGNHLVDPEGNQVMLHGVMDTPSPYFSGYRFTNYAPIDVYSQGDNYLNSCLNYFNNLFTAVTDTAQGSWCNVFRLHLDPCWTDNPNVKAANFTIKKEVREGRTVDVYYDPNGTEVSGEANIYHFDKSRLARYLRLLYFPIAKRAKGHGMYVIMRPPGVCPSKIKVGDYYQKYLLNVWGTVTKNDSVLKNSDWLSIELANEPVAILDADGVSSNSAMHDYFQPIVDTIRANGFKGIIWVPGGTWQQDYRPYAKKPITDPMLGADGQSAGQIGYAVHFYPGWFSTSDTQTDTLASINSFLDGVPVVKTSPIMITEVDWSPKDPTGQGHYNESGTWVEPNCGTWATGSTSKFGKGYRAVIDYFGNIGWTLTHTHDYMDIDYYLSSKKLRPAFSTKLDNNAYEACSGACFQWYKEYAHRTHVAREWEVIPAADVLPMDESVDQAAQLNGRILFPTDLDDECIFMANTSGTPQNIKVGTFEDIADNPYCWFKFTKVSNPGCSTKGNLYTIQICTSTGGCYECYGNQGYLNTPPGTWCLFALGITGHTYGQDADYYGLWKVDYVAGKGYTIQNVGASENSQNSWISPVAGTPQANKLYVHLYGKIGKRSTDLQETFSDNGADAEIYDLLGQRVSNLVPGRIYIRNGRKMIVR